MRYRSRNDIAYDILKVIADAPPDGARKTRIMYKAYLSFPQMQDYLAMLTKGQMISYDQKAKTYTLTEKGRYFMQTYSQMGGMILQRVKQENRHKNK
nr:winged helix-turn-helix domain-containing protein [uncultured Nitrososphaera sp.]